MLLYLKEQGVDVIINTDHIVSVCKSTNKTNLIDDSFLNLKPDEKIPETTVDDEEKIDIFLSNGQIISVNYTVEKFWLNKL